MSTSLLRRIVSGAAKSFSAPRGRRGWNASSGFGPVSALEARVVLSGTGAVFGSALAIGNDIEGTSSTANAVATDSAGNRYVTGSFSGTVDFDLNATSAGNAGTLTARGTNDVYVAKYAPNGSLIWVVQLGGDSVRTDGRVTDVGREIEVSSSGSVLVAGQFRETGSFGAASLVSAGGLDVFVTSISSSGTVQWARSWGNAADDYVHGIEADSAGNVHALSQRVADVIEIRKFTSSGAAAWAKSVAVRSDAVEGGLAVDPSGNVYVGGVFEGSVDFDPGAKTKIISSGTSSYGSAFVMSLNSKGDLRWVSPFITRTGSSTGLSKVGVQNLAWDSNGYVVAGGGYWGLVDMQPSTAQALLRDGHGLFVTKLTASSGSLAWTKGFDASAGSGSMYGLDVDAAGGIYVTGSFSGSLTLNPGGANPSATSLGESDIYVAKLNSAGDTTWFETFGGTGSDIGWDVAVGSDGTVHLAGAFSGTVDFDPDESSTYELTTSLTKKKGYLLRLLQA